MTFVQWFREVSGRPLNAYEIMMLEEVNRAYIEGRPLRIRTPRGSCKSIELNAFMISILREYYEYVKENQHE